MSQDSPQDQERTAAEVARDCPLSDEALALLTPQLTPGKYVATLIGQKQFADAVRFTAFNLPRREAIWWAALCLWDACRVGEDEKLPMAVDGVFRTLVAWLQEPSEANRRAVEAAGRETGSASPYGQLATAAFFSGGNVSLPDQPEVEPKPSSTAKAAASVVLAASKMKKPPNAVAAQQAYLVLAADLTKGKLPWALEKEEAAS